MSRIGKLPVNLPKSVTVNISDTNFYNKNFTEKAKNAVFGGLPKRVDFGVFIRS